MNVAAILNIKGRAVAAAGAEAGLMGIVRLLAGHKVGAMAIADHGGGLCGIISQRDIVRALSARGDSALSRKARDFMTRDVVTCGEADSVAALMERMTAGRFRRMPVVGDGRTVGIISIGDVVKQRISEAGREAEAMRAYIAAG